MGQLFVGGHSERTCLSLSSLSVFLVRQLENFSLESLLWIHHFNSVKVGPQENPRIAVDTFSRTTGIVTCVYTFVFNFRRFVNS